MTESIHLINSDWLWLVVVGAIVMAILLLVKEWKTKAGGSFALRSGIAFVAIVSLALIALRPAVSYSTDARSVVILTTGYNQDVLDSLENAVKPEVIRYVKGKGLFPPGNVYDQAFVLGEGLLPDDLWQLDDLSVELIPGEKPEGLVKIKHSRKVTSGDPVWIKGLYRDTGNAGKMITLETSAGNALDSVSVVEKEAWFELSSETKAEGGFLYYVTVKDSMGQQVAKEPVPVIVEKEMPLKVLILNTFPTFEIKYLKNFLAEEGHVLTVRNQISRGKYTYEYLNGSLARTPLFSEEILQEFDLIILDAPSLHELPDRHLRSIEDVVRRAGVGVFVLPAENLFEGAGPKRLSLQFLKQNDGKVLLEGQSVEKYKYRIKEQFALGTIHEFDGLLLSANVMTGAGRVGTTVLKDLWSLKLQGQEEAYRKLWVAMIEETARNTGASYEWRPVSRITFPLQPFHFELRTSIDGPVVFSDSTQLPLAQDVDLPFLWQGTAWPEHSGWHEITLEQDSSAVFHYYVQATGAWQAAVSEQTIMRNQQRAGRAGVSEAQRQEKSKPVDLIWFYLIFAFSIGYLWLAPKL